MRSKLVIGNWKMHGSRETCTALIGSIKAELASIPAAIEIGICPPAVYLPLAIEQCRETRIACGAQNVSQFERGAYTGEIACQMLADIDASLVLIGHSERRTLFAESDTVIAEKFVAAKQASLLPVLCVGESLAQRKEGSTRDVVLSQLRAVIGHAGIAAFDKAVIAYEPVWAIGTGETATPEQAQEVHSFIREDLAAESEEIASAIKILYGGSVKDSNSAELFAQSDIDGGLVGGASLEAEQFITICKNADI